MAVIPNSVDDILGGTNLTVADIARKVFAYFFNPTSFTLIPEGTEIADGQTAFTTGDVIDISFYSRKNLLIKVDQIVTVTFDVSDDDVVWHKQRVNLMNGATAGDLSETLTADKGISIPLSGIASKYIRPVIDNSSGNTATVNRCVLEVA